MAATEQFRAGRQELPGTTFETFEREIRGQLNDMLGPGGFDAARDIKGITVNRWRHGHAVGINENSGELCWFAAVREVSGSIQCVRATLTKIANLDN